MRPFLKPFQGFMQIKIVCADSMIILLDNTYFLSHQVKREREGDSKGEKKKPPNLLSGEGGYITNSYIAGGRIRSIFRALL